MFELCEELLSDDRIKDKFLKGIPLYDPSTLEKGSLFPSNDQPESDEVDDCELDDWANPDGELPYDRIDKEIHKWKREDYAKQLTLAFALSILSKGYAKRAKEAEEFIKVIKEEEPGAYLKVWWKMYESAFDEEWLQWIARSKANREKLKKFLQKIKWENWDRDFNWYAPHTTAEISMAVKLHPDTIRKHFPPPQARITSGKKANSFQYSADEMVEGMEWWWHYLLGKCKDRIQMHSFVQEIMEANWFKNLSKDGEEKISRVLVEPIRSEPISINGFYPFGRP